MGPCCSDSPPEMKGGEDSEIEMVQIQQQRARRCLSSWLTVHHNCLLHTGSAREQPDDGQPLIRSLWKADLLYYPGDPFAINTESSGRVLRGAARGTGDGLSVLIIFRPGSFRGKFDRTDSAVRLPHLFEST
ncbi:hypothetical protein BD413DRAFT_559259 [Trametes elegans]|nr:hypothetical protein BD413DRAFT_559259 [Trametes elegans]